jgi:hypothetical protein
MLGLLWAQLEHHVATGFGVSDASYKSTTDKLLYGIGQGSCSSPIVWALLNQLLLMAPGEEFDCISLVSVDGRTTDTHPGDSFVDDTTTGATYDNHNLYPISSAVRGDKLLPLPQPPVRSRTDARTNPSAQRATQLRRVLARVYAVSIQNQITTTIP